MSKLKRFRIMLTGGLGNQLFQLAFALSNSSDRKIILNTSLGAPRTSADGKVDIAAFELPEHVSFETTRKESWLLRKVVGYNLRAGVSPGKFENNYTFNFLLNLISSGLLSLRFGEKIHLIKGYGVGFFSAKIPQKNIFAVGYFQSFRWLNTEGLKTKIKELQVLGESEYISKLRNKSLTDKPLVVHVRLGDYKNEEKIGILSKKYYEEAITTLISTGSFNKIWAFSDEPHDAIEWIPEKYRRMVEWVSKPMGSPAVTMSEMRLGYGYVIGNSTFSWWGAYMSENPNAPVIAPEPWFLGAESPVELIPPNWVRLPGWVAIPKADKQG